MRRIARKKAIMTGTAAHGNFTEDSTLPAFLRLVPVFTVIVLSTILHTLPLFLIALLKWLLPIPAWRRACAHALVRIAESWIGFNSWLFTHATPTRFQVSGLEALRRDGHYLVLANHRSWVDIVAMQYAFNRRIPFLRFFLKRELIWVPFLGVAWWALDFPFMRRASRRELAIPAMADGSSYEQDSAVRVRYQRWVNEIWADKDARLVRILSPGAQQA
jgi:1-acyl-sn-glycerol-3-phosphate acyltransferase